MKTSEEKSRFTELETRIQTVGMVLIVAFLSWVGTGLVDVKVGLAQVLSESVALRSTLDKQERSIAVMSKEMSRIERDMGQFVTREELRETLRTVGWTHPPSIRNQLPDEIGEE